MDDIINNLKRDTLKIMQSLDIFWPSQDKVIWFDYDSLLGAEKWGIAATKLPGKATSKNIRNVPLHVENLLHSYSKLCHIGRIHFGVGPSAPTSSWGKDGPKWPGTVRRVTSLCLSSSTVCREDILSGQALKNAVEKVISKIDDLWRDECLILNGFPLYFELNIYVILLIGTLFRKVGLVSPEGPNITILLYKFHSWDLSTKKLLNKVLSEMDGADPLQLYISQAANFFDCNFYRAAVDMSYVHLQEMILDILKNLEKGENLSSLSRDVPDTVKATSTVEPLVCLDDEEEEAGPVKLSNLEESDLVSIYLNQIDLVEPTGDDGVVWLQFPCSEAPEMTLVKKEWKHSTFKCTDLSKFCLTSLAQCQINLCRLLQNSYHVDFKLHSKRELDFSFMMKKWSWPSLFLDAHVLDFGMESWYCLKNHFKHQRGMLKMLISVLNKMENNDCLALRCYPLLSEFNVSVVFVLSYMFEKVGFLVPSDHDDVILLFYNFYQFNEDIFSHLNKAVTDKSVSSLVSLSSIYGAEEFYESIRNLNNLCLKLQCVRILEFVKEMEE